MGAILGFETVGFRHGMEAEVLSNIAFELPRGRCALVSGGAGSGKTTLAGLAALDLIPSRGNIRLFDTDVTTVDTRDRIALRRRIALVSESLPLVAGLSVRENIALPLAIRGVSKREANIRIRELTDWLGLADHGEALPEALSHAERERVALARAVIARPELLIADELLSSPDPREIARVLPLLARLVELGTAMLITGRAVDWAASLPGAVRWQLTPNGLRT